MRPAPTVVSWEDKRGKYRADICPRLLRVDGLREFQSAFEDTGRPLTALEQNPFGSGNRAPAGNDQIAFADDDADVFGGHLRHVNDDKVGIGCLMEVQRRTPARPSRDGPGTINQLFEHFIHLAVQVEKRAFPGTQGKTLPKADERTPSFPRREAVIFFVVQATRLY